MKTLEILGANRFETYTKTRDACRAVIIHDDRILLIHETVNDLWLIPGGGMEDGETSEECVAREVCEETGLIVVPTERFLTINEYYEEYRYSSHYFVCEVIGEGQMNLTDEEKKRGSLPEWLPLHEAIELFSKYESYADVSEEKRGIYQREYLALSEYMNCSLRKILPDSIFRLVDGKSFSFDRIGMSGSKILIFEDSVLKIVPCGMVKEDDVRMMKWLEGKIPVPRIIAYKNDEKNCYILMSKVAGKMSCDEYYLKRPKELLAVLAKTLKLLWSVDVSACPCSRDIDAELKEAQYRVDHDLVDTEAEIFKDGGFENPQALLKWLYDNKPDYEPVLSHGDFCLPNVFIKNGEVSGLIDLGAAGVGDKWRDIALCYRSLKQNFDGTFGGTVYPDFDPDLLFAELGMKPDYAKLRYYLLLDELF